MLPYVDAMFSNPDVLNNNRMVMVQHQSHFEQNVISHTILLNLYKPHPSQHRNVHQYILRNNRQKKRASMDNIKATVDKTGMRDSVK
jgi:hypothetical protein